MRKETVDTIFSFVMACIIAGTIYEVKYLFTHTFEFHFIDFFFVLFLYESIRTKKMLFRLNEKIQEYAVYFKIYMDTKLGNVSVDDVRKYFENLKNELEKDK